MRETAVRLLRRFGPTLFVAACYVTSVLVFWVGGTSMIDSDFASEMMLSKMLLDGGGGILTNAWIYSTELRVLNTQLVFQLGLLLFPHSWHAARTFAVAVFILLVLLSERYLMKVLGTWERYRWLAAVLLVPVGQLYGWIVLYGSYYVPHLCILLVALGLFLTSTGHGGTHRRAATVAGLVLALVSGLGGVRQPLLCYAPLFLVCALASVVPRLFEDGTADAGADEATRQSGLLLLASGVGYLINGHVLSRFYRFMPPGPGQVIEDPRLSEIVDYAFSGCIGTWGYRGVGGITGFSALWLLCQVVFCLLVGAAVVWCTRRRRELAFGPRVVLGVFFAALVLNAVLFYLKDHPAREYLVPTSVLAFFLVPFALEGLARERVRPVVRRGAEVALLCCLCVLALGGWKTVVLAQREGPNKHQQVAAWLEEHDYTQGLATFWNANVLVELTDGRISTWHYMDDVWEQPWPYAPPFYAWLTPVDHEHTPPEGRVFFVASDEEREEAGLASFDREPEFVVEDLSVYTFDSYEDYVDAVTDDDAQHP